MTTTTRTKKRVFKKLTLRLNLWEHRDIEQLKKETFCKTSSKAIIKAATNYIKLKETVQQLQNEIDYLKYEQSR